MKTRIVLRGKADAKPRNLPATSPLLRKGGVHDEGRPDIMHRRARRSGKLALNRLLRHGADWRQWQE